jgi:antitoxin HigA-1
MNAMKMYNPPHPGEIIRELCLKGLDLTVTSAAQGLGVTRKTLSAILNGHAGISPEMAMRLSKAFGSTPDHWLKMQNAFDLWQLRAKNKTLRVKAYTASGQSAFF